MTTDAVDGFLIDRGAQFLSSNYSVLLSLISELGLDSAVRPASPWGAVVRNGVPRRVKGGDFFGALRHGIITPKECFRFARSAWWTRKAMRSLPTDNYSRWADFDHETAAEWCHREIGRNANEYVVEPALSGLFFQEPEVVSGALFAALSAFHFRRSKTLTLQGGIGCLADKLAAKLDVALNTSVASVQVMQDFVAVKTPNANFAARWVVLATTAAAARKLYSPRDEIEQRLLETPYAANINIAVMTKPGYPIPASLHAVYGILIPRSERRHIAAISIETNKCQDRAAQGQLFHLMLCGKSSAEMLSQTDSQVSDAVKQEAERFLPGVFERASNIRVYRWPEAIALSPVGRARNLRLYRQATAGTVRRVLMAGDYMSCPWTDGSAESGVWAANSIIERDAIHRLPSA